MSTSTGLHHSPHCQLSLDMAEKGFAATRGCLSKSAERKPTVDRHSPTNPIQPLAPPTTVSPPSETQEPAIHVSHPALSAPPRTTWPETHNTQTPPQDNAPYSYSYARAGPPHVAASSKAPGIGGNQPLYATFTGDVDYEHKYPPDAYGEESSATARVWSVYNDEAHDIDAQMIRSFNSTLDVLLVFAGLFSAVVTTFVAQSSQALSPDYAQITASLVYELVLMQRAAESGKPSQVPMSPLSFNSETHQPTDIWVNALWLHYHSLPKGSPRDRAHLRHYRFRSLERWKVPAIVGLLPGLLTIALLLFLAGLVVHVAPTDSAIFGITLSLTATALILYAITITLPIFIAHCAYKTPMSDYIAFFAQGLKQTVYLSFRVIYQTCHCPRIYFKPCDPPFTNKKSRMESLELSDVRRHANTTLMMETLTWLVQSSLNTSAASITVQAASAHLSPSSALCIMDSALTCLRALVDQRPPPLALATEHAANIERFARVLLNASASVYTEEMVHQFYSQLWQHLHAHRAHTTSPPLRAVLCLALWVRACSEADPLPDRACLRSACELLDLSSPELELHPVIWARLDHMMRVCLLLCDSRYMPGSTRSRYWTAYNDAKDATDHSSYNPMGDRRDPYSSTATTLLVYAQGCRWHDGQKKFVRNLEKLKLLATPIAHVQDSQDDVGSGGMLETSTDDSDPSKTDGGRRGHRLGYESIASRPVHMRAHAEDSRFVNFQHTSPPTKSFALDTTPAQAELSPQAL
ncbi:hypothetical protein K525DRAFT_291389 [Schizophyllum commune Loenen D]|nr:hypothetical protein K525DRAFT_291389 [Schizophyllum commune Loenen D]